MLPIKVIWLSFAHHRASIYISSYICFECHWTVPWSSTLNPTGNVHDSLLLPVTLTIPEMSSLISLSYRLPLHYFPSYSTTVRLEFIFIFLLNVLLDFILFLLYGLLSNMQWIRGFPPVQVNVFIMLHIYNNIQKSTPAFSLTFAAPSSSVLLCIKLHLAVIFRLWPWFPLRTKHTSSCWQWGDKRKVERKSKGINQSINGYNILGYNYAEKNMATDNQQILPGNQFLETLHKTKHRAEKMS